MAGRVSRQLDLPANPQTWSDDQTQIFLLSQGVDLPGSVVTGADCLRRALEQAVFPDNSTLVPEAETALRYPALAAEIMTVLPGSPAGGEHPKIFDAPSVIHRGKPECAGEILPAHGSAGGPALGGSAAL
ncbi:MAG: HipA domain protein [Verrucomicrobiales bacterium]|nr:HipA domain protein [Verrucomicrobiales bacterium]